MAISNVTSNASTNPLNPTVSCTILIPADVQAGDLLFAQATSRNHTATNAVLRVVDTEGAGNAWIVVTTSADRTASLWYKYATANTSSKVATFSTAINSLTAGLTIYRGAHTSTPFSNVTVEENVSGNETHAGIFPDSASSMICLGVYNIGNDNAVANQSTETNPGALLELWEKLSSGGSDCACVHASQVQTTDRASTGAFTWTQTNNTTRSIVWAVPPDVPPPPPAADYIRITNTLQGLGSGLMAAGARIECRIVNFYSYMPDAA